MEMLQVMSVARRIGALVMIHAENFDAIRFLVDKLEREGHVEPYFHAISRPIPVEREATHRAISLAELVDVPIMIVHVSNGEAMEEIRRAQAKGMKVYGETCPQYLVLTEKDLEGLNMEGAKYVCSPPPRDKESQDACWRGLETGIFSVFSSDHCPFRYDDPAGKLNPKGPNQLPLGSERDSGGRGAAPHPVLGGGQQGADRPEPVRGALGHEPRQDLWALPTKGHHRGRI
jgi:dihydropyrimidinase